jgi:hypothetical protein
MEQKDETSSAQPAKAEMQPTKKEIRDEIEKQMQTALMGWKDELGEKKFQKRIRKAGKLFGRNLKHTAVKASAMKKAVSKK